MVDEPPRVETLGNNHLFPFQEYGWESHMRKVGDRDLEPPRHWQGLASILHLFFYFVAVMESWNRSLAVAWAPHEIQMLATYSVVFLHTV